MKPKRKTGLKILSVILAFLLWIYVTDKGDFNTPYYVTSVNLNYYNVPENLTYTGPESVSVRVWGSVSETDEKNMVVYVDLNGLGAGTYHLPVRMNPLPGVLFARVSPDSVMVELVSLSQQEYPINIELSAPVASGWEVLDLASVPNKCVVQGEKEVLDAIQKVVVTVSAQNVTGINAQRLKLQARDSSGQMISSGIRIIPEEVQVFSVLSPQMESKTMPVHAVVVNEYALQGYRIKMISVEPDSVLVFGSKTDLDNHSQLLYTKEIDMGSIVADDFKQQNYDLEMELEMPANMKAYPSKVRVFIEVEPETEDIRI